MPAPQKQLVSFYLEPETIMLLTAQAEADGITRSELIVKYLREAMDRPPCDPCTWRRALARASKP